jgi:SAM-dependent methyltransferase
MSEQIRAAGCCGGRSAVQAAGAGQGADAQREQVREQYGLIAQVMGSGCCGPQALDSSRLGYGGEELVGLPEGADLGLGCGNPVALASLAPGEVVLDLGSGGGIDCFLAGQRVGEGGRVIGVDMTPPMVSRARDAARRMGIKNVEFRLGEIERLPVADASVDVIMSNCVLNLSPEKPAVLGEAARVLRSGGRLAISDVVLLRPLPPALAAAAEALTGCVSGAATVEELGRWLEEAGFVDVKIEPKPESRQFIKDWFPGSGAEEYVASAMIVARRP